MATHYDENEIRKVIAGLWHGNPGRDIEAVKLLERIILEPDSGIGVALKNEIRQALQARP